MMHAKLTESEKEQVLARDDGFKCIPDPQRGLNWYSFQKGDLHVWNIREGWQTSYLLNGRYTGHKNFKTLEEALKR